ncbi:MAG: DNA polymerase IV [Gemmatimonadetes bacterium]|nr:DNA polymerase IV [Gemmatimonadota bacterium]MYG15012.1 DNA polymerase IV [Gemmatimonadota bacterium]MYH18451.1 DNA polymerase IV [Gemmatimonadota bacterium]MYK97430.1 DNA polymerase IV [Gemmatimonadota bacterium]
MNRPRTILHADMDAFFAAVEQRDRPELRGKPVIVGGDGPRSVVSTCSYEAREYGVHSAMPGTTARKLCPQGIFLPVRSEAYGAVSRQVQEVFHRYTPLVEPLSLDEAFLDVTGSSQLFGDGEAIARSIKSDVLKETRLTISVGVSPCKFVAKVASDLDKPDGLVIVLPDRVLDFLAPLPVSCLWGAGRDMQERMVRHGLRTIGDVQQRSSEELQRLLGNAAGAHFARISRGQDDRPVVTGHPAKSVGHENTFGTDLSDREECHGVLVDQSDKVGRRLRKAGRLGRTVRVKVRFGDFRTLTRQAAVAPTDNDFVIGKTALELFDGVWDGKTGIRLLGVAVGNLVMPEEPVQTDLFREGDGQSDRLVRALDTIRDRYGRRAIRHGASAMKA